MRAQKGEGKVRVPTGEGRADGKGPGTPAKGAPDGQYRSFWFVVGKVCLAIRLPLPPICLSNASDDVTKSHPLLVFFINWR